MERQPGHKTVVRKWPWGGRAAWGKALLKEEMEHQVDLEH